MPRLEISMVWRIAFFVLLAVSGGCSRDWDGSASAPSPTAGRGAATDSTSLVRVAKTPPASHPELQGFARAPDRGDLVAYPASAAPRRDGAYTWHRSDISEAHALAAIGSGRLQVRTPSGETLDFRYQRHVEHPNGDWTWIGRLENGAPGEETILTFGEKAVFGSIGQRGKEPLKLTIRYGVSWLVETDPTQIAGINNSATRPQAPDYFIPPKLARRGAADVPVSTAQGTGTASAQAAAAGTSGAMVDVVLGYTNGFAAGWGGQSQANTRLNFLVDVTNQAYVNSQIDAQVRLVHTIQVSYPDATDNGLALEELTGYRSAKPDATPATPAEFTTPAAAFSELRAARDQYGADVVSLVRKFNTPENKGCGIAWLIGASQSGIDQSDAYFGYSVVSDGTDAGDDGKNYFCREETLAHEIGHNAGSAHNRDEADGDDNVLQAKEYGAFPYSFGYKTTAMTGDFFTVMAYGDSGQKRLRTFSNPRTTCEGVPCGTPGDDNARSLAQTLHLVATFRATVVPFTPTIKRARGDVDGDGRSDLLLQNSGFGQTAYWIMNGATPVRYSAAFTQPAGYAQVATGDFNGDNKLDIVWARSSDRTLLLWQGDGSGFTQLAIRDYEAGWAVTGAGDIDGDGKSDLLLANASQGLSAYWIMNGATPTRYSSVFTQPAGHAQVATGDFNGDGKLDLVWARSSDRALVMWQGNGIGFTQYGVRDYVAGWAVTGAGDIDGDGKSDLLLTNASQGLAAYWIMNGATPVRYSSAFNQPSGYAQVVTGDYNGDSRLDIVWARSSDRTLLLWQGDGNGFAQAVIRDYVAGWAVVGDMASTGLMKASVRGDIDGDGRSDLLLQNTGFDLTAYWIMNGATPVRYSSAVMQPSGYARVATGDFNGDGKLDIVWARGADRTLLLWQGDGIGFTSLSIRDYVAGWAVTGAGDIDGDGKSDLLLANPGEGLSAYWIMSGATPVRYSSAFLQPAGHGQVATGDFNGDGKLDILWARGSDRTLLLWQGDGTGFTQLAVRDYNLGWAVTGAGDIDGDGKSDLLLANATQGLSAYWIMNGAVPMRYSSAFNQPAGYAQVAIGDYNGDAKLDLAWVRSSDRALLMWLGDGNGFAALPVGNHNEGWLITQP